MSSNTTLIITLNNISTELNRFYGSFVFLFGCFGNILNLLVLSRRRLRSNPCALLFLVSSIFNLTALLVGLTSRVLSGWNLDPTNKILFLCKLRIFLTFPSRTAAFWLIMLAAVDRWLLSSTHVHYRQLSTLKNAQRGIIIIVVLSSVLFIHAPICYEISSSSNPLQCYAKNRSCRLAVDVAYGFLTIGLPIILMNVFSMKTIINVHRLKQRIHPLDLHTNSQLVMQGNVSGRKWKKKDQRLLMMLIVQIICFTVLTFPIVIYRIFSTVTIDNDKSNLQSSIENLIYNFILLTSYLACGIPFYVYTLTGGKTFRKALSNILQCK